jgi:hypothetical protein
VSILSNLQKWLGQLIDVRGLDVSGEESTLTIQLQYVLRRTGESQTASIIRTV